MTCPCRAYWCAEPALDGEVLCSRHAALLPAGLRDLSRGVLQATVAHVAEAQMRAAFAALPEDAKEVARAAAKKL